MALSMAANQKVALSLKGVGSAGGDTTQQFAGNAAWTVDSALLSLTPDATTLACSAVALGALGTTTVSLTATDTKGRAFSATVSIEIVPVLEVTDHIEIAADVPVDQ